MKQLNKSGKMSLNVNNWIAVIIGVVILFSVLADLYPVLTSSGEGLYNASFPLGSLFTDGGAAWYILAAAVIYLLISSLSGSRK